MKDKILIYGAGGHAKVVIDAIEKEQKYKIMAIVDDNSKLHGKNYCGYPVIGGLSKLVEGKFSDFKIIIAITDGKVSSKLYRQIKSLGYKLGIVIHPSAVVARDVLIGPGTMVMANAVINSNAKIGTNVVINTGAIVEHDCEIGDFVHIAPGAHLAGAVKIGEASMVGLGATVIESRQIGENSIIGAGTVVINDIPNNVSAVGVPARIMKRS
ncbi:MAG: hypothetical protein AMJ92_04200 [candidate division Zixibacteria bacterium SM23_81]|nr:MAG: hypothetical protein AMJ92_04200 [candidate division Zixibacteria bacterium SM23_81]